jgi:predicted metalloprotease
MDTLNPVMDSKENVVVLVETCSHHWVRKAINRLALLIDTTNLIQVDPICEFLALIIENESS